MVARGWKRSSSSLYPSAGPVVYGVQVLATRNGGPYLAGDITDH